MDWSVGQRVAIYVPEVAGPLRVATIRAVRKNGNVVVEGVSFKPHRDGYAYRAGRADLRMIRLFTAEVERELVRCRKRRRMHHMAQWLADADPDTLPDELLEKLREAHSIALLAKLQAKT